jgi:hypothetical protein
MDFVVGLPRTTKGYDSIWFIVDRLSKSAHFLPVDTRYSAKKYAKLYFDRIVTLHGVPLTIIYDRGQFLCHASGCNYRSVLVPVFSEVQLIIHRPMVK